MAYEKQTWETGQVITAEKLNHMEDGIASGRVLVVILEQEGSIGSYKANYTYDEVASFINMGGYVVFKVDKRTTSLEQPKTYYYAGLIQDNYNQGNSLSANMASNSTSSQCFVDWNKWGGITVSIK